MQPITNKMMSYSEVLEYAKKDFDGNENQEAIIDTIKSILDTFKYDEAEKNNARAKINFDWSFTGWAQGNVYRNSTEFKVKQSAMSFFQKLPNVNCSIDK